MKKQTLPLALAGGALAVLTAGCAWYQLGWGQNIVRLTDLNGDAAALKGFTLHGEVLDVGYTCAFTLKDGALTNRVSLKGLYSESANSVRLVSNCRIAPDAAEALNRELLPQSPAPDTLFSGSADRFIQQVTFWFPDDTVAVVDTRTVTTDLPVSVYAYGYKNGSLSRGWHYRIGLPDGRVCPASGSRSEQEEAAVELLDSYQTAQSLQELAVELDGEWYLLLDGPSRSEGDPAIVDPQPGIYRVRPVPQSEAPAACDTAAGASVGKYAPCGSLERVCPAPEGAAVLTAAGGSLCLYYTEGKTLRLDVLDTEGNVTDTAELGAFTGPWLHPRPQLDPEQTSVAFPGATLVTRVQNGRITARGRCADAEAALLLSADNSRVLAVSDDWVETVLPGSAGGADRQVQSLNGKRLTVYPAAGSALPLCTARLDAGQFWDELPHLYSEPYGRTGGILGLGPDSFQLSRNLYLKTSSGALVTG